MESGQFAIISLGCSIVNFAGVKEQLTISFRSVRCHFGDFRAQSGPPGNCPEKCDQNCASANGDRDPKSDEIGSSTHGKGADGGDAQPYHAI
jgi:hypothetical protein